LSGLVIEVHVICHPDISLSLQNKTHLCWPLRRHN